MPRGVGQRYRRLGFNCESIVNAKCDFGLRAQLLERDY